MSYTQFDATKPVGTDTGPNVVISANANDKALRDAIITGQMHGFVFSVTGGTARQPATMTWTNGGTVLTATLTWGTTGGPKYNITQAVWALGADTIDTQTFSYDSAGNLTGTTAAGGFVSWLVSLIGRVGLLEDSATSLGASIAGLGTIATQDANAVSITGGAAEVDYEREKTTVLGNLNTSQAINWKAQGVVTVTVTGSSATFTYSNLPPGGNGGMSGGLLFRVTNGGLATNLFGSAKKPAGFSLSPSGLDWVAMMCVDGTTPEITGVAKAVA